MPYQGLKTIFVLLACHVATAVVQWVRVRVRPGSGTLGVIIPAATDPNCNQSIEY